MAPDSRQWCSPSHEESSLTLSVPRTSDMTRRIVSKSRQETPSSLSFSELPAELLPISSPRFRRIRQRSQLDQSVWLNSSQMTICRFVNGVIWILILVCTVYCHHCWTTSSTNLNPPVSPETALRAASNINIAPEVESAASRRLHEASGRQNAGLPPSDPVLHIVHTRFMQNQPDLVHLGLARLELLKEFSLRSLDQQSNQNFLWVIRTDPDLNETVKQPLIELLQDHDHHLLLATNENPNIQVAELLNVDSSTVWSGDLEYAKQYLSQPTTLAETDTSGVVRRKVLESRLDADDALHVDFIDEVQGHAVDELTLEEQPQPTWKIWCASRHLEWQFESASGKVNDTGGVLLSLKDNICVSSGLTVGYTEGVQVHDLPKIKHQELAHTVKSCKGRTSRCLDFINLFPTALRARTPTSAGMLNVLLQGKAERIDRNYFKGAKKQETMQDRMWEVTTPRFGFTWDDAFRLREYLKDHLHGIAVDNLKGQCSQGHSCKESSKKLLQSLVEETGVATE